MAELREDFILLIKYSCQVALPQCEALLNLPPVKSVLGQESSSDRKVRVLRSFLDAAVAHAIEHASPKKLKKGYSAQDVVRAAAANIGLKPWSGKRKNLRDDTAGLEVGYKDGGSVRRPDWRDQFAGTLVQVITDFLEDRDAAQAWVRNTEGLLRSSTPVQTDQSASPSVADNDQRPPLLSSYVRRPELEAKFRALVDAGAKLIVLVGQPGMGKTSLAQAVTGDAPRIRVYSGQVRREDFVGPFESRGLNPDIVSTTNPAILLARLVMGNDAPPFVILDNLDSTDEISSFLPAMPTDSILVATCRTKGPAFVDIRNVIQIGGMKREEARQQARRLLPDADESDVDLIASTFHDYPLVIEYACSEYKNQESSLLDFCRDIEAEAASEASDMYTKEGTSLLVVLRRLIGSLRQRDPLSFEQLVCLSMSEFGELSTIFLARYLQVRADEPSERRSTRALRLLADYSFVTETARTDYSDSPARRYVALHPFVREIVAEEFKSKEVEVCQRTLEVCLAYKPTGHHFYLYGSETDLIISDGNRIFHHEEPPDEQAEPLLANLYDQFVEIRYAPGIYWPFPK